MEEALSFLLCGLLAAVILKAVLVGSMITVFHLARQKPTGQLHTPQNSSTAGSTPGQIVYSTPQENGWVSGLAWSANGQRIAAAVGNNADENINIWDATTGQHKVTIPLNPSPGKPGLVADKRSAGGSHE